MSVDIDRMSNDEIVRRCHDPALRVSGDPDARGFVKILDHVMVKCGWSITPSEAANQQFAYKHSQHDGLKVPEVYRFFQREKRGYLVMEFIKGISLDELNTEQLDHVLPELARTYWQQFHQPAIYSPGPRKNGVPRGYLFSEDGAGVPLNSMRKLNRWMNTRGCFKDDEEKFDFKLSDCTFCHLDLARRNIILCPDGSLCLLDWEQAGFYPTVFEAYCLLFVGIFDRKFSENLFQHISEFAGWSRDDKQLLMLDRVYANNMRYSFSTPTRNNLCAIIRRVLCCQSLRKPPAAYTGIPSPYLGPTPPPPPPLPPPFPPGQPHLGGANTETTPHPHPHPPSHPPPLLPRPLIKTVQAPSDPDT